MDTPTNQQQTQGEDRNLPTHVVKIRHGHGKAATYEKIGVAWADPEKGSTYIRLYGTQVISDGFSIYPITA